MWLFFSLSLGIKCIKKKKKGKNRKKALGNFSSSSSYETGDVIHDLLWVKWGGITNAEFPIWLLYLLYIYIFWEYGKEEKEVGRCRNKENPKWTRRGEVVQLFLGVTNIFSLWPACRPTTADSSCYTRDPSNRNAVKHSRCNTPKEFIGPDHRVPFCFLTGWFKFLENQMKNGAIRWP